MARADAEFVLAGMLRARTRPSSTNCGENCPAHGKRFLRTRSVMSRLPWGAEHIEDQKRFFIVLATPAMRSLTASAVGSFLSWLH